jgi:hypothetical protein
MRAVALVGVAAMLAIMVACGGSPSQPVTSSPAASPIKTAELPYPECPKILAALCQELDDPEGMEVLDWGRQVQNTKQGDGKPNPPFLDYTVKVRCRSSSGGKEIQVWLINFGTGSDVIQVLRRR